MKDAKHFELATYVDEWPSFSVLLCLFPDSADVHSNAITFQATDDLKLKYVLQNTRVIDWNDNLCFKGIESKFKSMLLECIPAHSELKETGRSDVYIYNKEDCSFKSDLTDGFYLAKLKPEDMGTIEKYWRFESRGLSLIRNQLVLDTHPTAGIFKSNTNELVAWGLELYFGSIGTVHTVELYRRRGFAKIIISYLTRKIRESKGIAWCHVQDVATKEISVNMVRSVGYKKTDMQHIWVAYTPRCK
ncbi:glycine N-acyltransferase-like protein 1 [Saccoglossus kowalevskii]